MPETNCDICLTDETLTFVNIANTTTTSKKFKIEAIGHNRIYACLDSDPSATFVNNVYSTCLAEREPCVAEVKTLTLKKPTVDLTQHSLVIKYLIESSGFTETLTDTLVYSNDYRDPTSTSYNVDYAETVCDNIRLKFEQYSNITFENRQPENVISPVNNCIDNRGDVQFELKLNGLNTSINPIDLILTEDDGITLIKVSTPATADKNAALNNCFTVISNLDRTGKT